MKHETLQATTDGLQIRINLDIAIVFLNGFGLISVDDG
jgi:hypothetical protein